MKDNSRKKLAKWQERLDRNMSAYSAELLKMDEREAQYNGDRTLRPTTSNDKLKDGRKRKTAHVWNITAENIDAIIDSTIPMPKVIPLWKKDEALARKIENMLRNEIERLKIEGINDKAERTAKKQGGVGLLVEWDASKRTHTTVGENVLSVLHPKKIIPQAGLEETDDMDYYFVRVPMTREAVKRRYGVEVENEQEEAPELRTEGDAEDMVTVNIAVYRNDNGGVGRFAWVGDTVCEDLKDCNARRLRRCKKCGMTETDAFMLDKPLAPDGNVPEDAEKRKPRKDECSFCGSRTWEYTVEEFREVPLSDLKRLGVRDNVIARLTAMNAGSYEMPGNNWNEIATAGMEQIAADAVPTRNEMVEMGAWGAGFAQTEPKVMVPYYKPELFPLVLMRNVTAENRFLGESDCDKIRDQQNTINRMEQKILDKTVKAGTRISCPADTHIRIDAEDGVFMPVSNMTDLTMLKQFDFSGDITNEITIMTQAYNEAQRVIGVTESFLGRKDTTATSGKAKEFAASQTVGRLESRRVLKKQAWADVFERMFKNMIAYADERRPVHYQDEKGKTEYEEFIPYEFLDVDDAGELYWNTQFLFACDDASGLASNREAMWQECTAHLQAGAYGNPTDVNTLIIYWTKMEELHYPGAGNTKKLLEEQKQAQMQQQALMMQMQQAQAQQTTAPQMG
ncbi:MAG: hypothetical protein ACI3VP_07845 [Oscillospiraceae bacterium]